MVMCGMYVAGFFDEATLTIEKEFHKVAIALSYEYRFAHSYSRSVCEKYGYRKYVLLLFQLHRVYTPGCQ